jgi:hypothetical protein
MQEGTGRPQMFCVQEPNCFLVGSRKTLSPGVALCRGMPLLELPQEALRSILDALSDGVDSYPSVPEAAVPFYLASPAARAAWDSGGSARAAVVLRAVHYEWAQSQYPGCVCHRGRKCCRSCWLRFDKMLRQRYQQD